MRFIIGLWGRIDESIGCGMLVCDQSRGQQEWRVARKRDWCDRSFFMQWLSPSTSTVFFRDTTLMHMFTNCKCGTRLPPSYAWKCHVRYSDSQHEWIVGNMQYIGSEWFSATSVERTRRFQTESRESKVNTVSTGHPQRLKERTQRIHIASPHRESTDNGQTGNRQTIAIISIGFFPGYRRTLKAMVQWSRKSCDPLVQWPRIRTGLVVHSS